MLTRGDMENVAEKGARKTLNSQQTRNKEPIWFDVREPVKSFTKRGEKLKDLYNALQSEGEGEGQVVISQMASISGLGGIGKTELAREYAREYKQDYERNVIWINAETQESLRDSFQRLVVELNKGLSEELKILITEKRDGKEHERDIKSIVKDVYKYFKDVKSLFIFDNAEEYKDVKEFLPFSLSPDDKKPYVLITSRNRHWEVGEEGKIEVIPLNEFTPEEAVRFVKKALNIENNLQDSDVKKLTEELQHFPLALGQAVTYIKERSTTLKFVGKKFEISDYLKEYETEEKKPELLNFELKGGRYTRTTFITWRITFESIRQKKYGKQALEILEIMAYLAPDGVSIKKFFSKLVVSEGELPEAVKLLNQYSMINVEQGISNIHRLVQAVIRLGLQEKGREEKILRKALELINSGYVTNESVSHVISVWSHVSKYGKLINDFYFKSIYDKGKDTPLHLLAENGDKETIEKILTYIEAKYLLRNKIEMFSKIIKAVNAEDKDNSTPLHLAAGSGNLDMVKLLVEKGAYINTQSNSWLYPGTPLRRAAENGHSDVVKYLAEKGANINDKDKDGRTPLHRAVLNDKLDVVKSLIEKGANFNAPDKDGMTPLHLAALEGHLDTVRYLLDEKGDDSTIKDNDGKTPLDLAKEQLSKNPQLYQKIIFDNN